MTASCSPEARAPQKLDVAKEPSKGCRIASLLKYAPLLMHHRRRQTRGNREKDWRGGLSREDFTVLYARAVTYTCPLLLRSLGRVYIAVTGTRYIPVIIIDHGGQHGDLAKEVRG